MTHYHRFVKTSKRKTTNYSNTAPQALKFRRSHTKVYHTMLILETHEKNAIRLAQKRTNEYKKRGETIICPFIHTLDTLKGSTEFQNVSAAVCVLCHKWMGTDLKTYSHPCNQMTHKTIVKRFWRDPDDEYPIST